MILGERAKERFGAIWVIYFPTNWGAKEPQNPPNNRVVVVRLATGRKDVGEVCQM